MPTDPVRDWKCKKNSPPSGMVLNPLEKVKQNMERTPMKQFGKAQEFSGVMLLLAPMAAMPR